MFMYIIYVDVCSCSPLFILLIRTLLVVRSFVAVVVANPSAPLYAKKLMNIFQI